MTEYIKVEDNMLATQSYIVQQAVEEAIKQLELEKQKENKKNRKK